MSFAPNILIDLIQGQIELTLEIVVSRRFKVTDMKCSHLLIVDSELGKDEL